MQAGYLPYMVDAFMAGNQFLARKVKTTERILSMYKTELRLTEIHSFFLFGRLPQARLRDTS
jgi:hypothetical protein